MSVEVQFPGRRGVDERGRPFESALLSERVITVAVIDEAKRRGARVADEESGMSMGIVRQLDMGEVRQRVDFNEELSTCFTKHSEHAGWQEGHFHEGSSEDYLVYRGKIYLAWLDPETTQLKGLLLHEGDRHTFDSGVVHKVYPFPHAMTLVTKLGSSSQDKILSTEIDALVSHLTEADMLASIASNCDG